MPTTYPASMTFLDKADTNSTTELNFGSADAITYVTSGTGDVNSWFAAVQAISLGSLTKESLGRQLTTIAPTPPTGDAAYNSSKLTVFYHDNVTGKKYRYSIPCRDATTFNTYPRSKNVILTIADGGTAEIEALVTATEAGVSPTGGSITVDEIVIAGGKQSG